MSQLYLLRHGEAELAAAHDEMRRLTDRGVQQVRVAASALPDSVTALYFSPYVRAVESARAVSETRAFRSESSAPWLVPDADLSDTLAQLAMLSGQDTLLVTHNPLVTYLAAALCDEPAPAVTFGTGALAQLTPASGDDWLPGCMTFRWL